MPNGGFLVKVNEKDFLRCYKITLDYDLGTYQANNEPPKKFPQEYITKIEIIPEK